MAHEVTFIGYSFPSTAAASGTLISEALKYSPREYVTVANQSHDESDEEISRCRYRSVLSENPDDRFHIVGAMDWIHGLP